MISKIVFVLAFEKSWKQSFLWHGWISLSLFKRMWPIDNHDCYVASGEVLGRSRRPSKASSVFMKRPSNGSLLLIYVRKINALSLRLPCKRIKTLALPGFQCMVIVITIFGHLVFIDPLQTSLPNLEEAQTADTFPWIKALIYGLYIPVCCSMVDFL